MGEAQAQRPVAPGVFPRRQVKQGVAAYPAVLAAVPHDPHNKVEVHALQARVPPEGVKELKPF